MIIVLHVLLSVVLIAVLMNDGGVVVAQSHTCNAGYYRSEVGTLQKYGHCLMCSPGNYCEGLIEYPCPSGRYGSSTGLTNENCDGLCAAGYYCPSGSTSATAFECGAPDMYCPTGSKVPLPVPIGFYTIGGDERGHTRSQAIKCPRGYYCTGGNKYPCPAGVFGAEEGLTNETCSGICPEGWFCPLASNSAVTNSCGNNPTKYCPSGSSRPQPVNSGYFAIQPHIESGGGYGAQEICPPGTYCAHGVQIPCPAGRYGTKQQEINASCTGECPAGYYCPLGSRSYLFKPCNSHLIYCPAGSAEPTTVSPGYFTVGVQFIKDLHNYTDDTIISILNVRQLPCVPGSFCAGTEGVPRLCPAGRFGATSALATADCSGYCAEGYYCPIGSTSPTAVPCGDASVYCPPGMGIPMPVTRGYYTVGYHDATTHNKEKKCEPGYYCVDGVKYYCDRGHYGSEFGMVLANCSGLCDAGHYCPQGSISPREIMCGDPNVFCPVGSYRPIKVDLGYFSVGDTESTRSTQEIAPIGHFASLGLLFTCRAGYFGSTEGLSTADCSGPCSVPGFYCPAGSISPVMNYCGGDDWYCPAGVVAPIKVDLGFYTIDYSNTGCPPGMWRNWSLSEDITRGNTSVVNTFASIPNCELCPANTFKIENGDSLSLCKPCFTRQATSSPDRKTCNCNIIVRPGFVSMFNFSNGKCNTVPEKTFLQQNDGIWKTNTSVTRYRQFECEPGYYCQDGLRYICPSGYYGSLYRVSNPTCTGVCAPGYYCPVGSRSTTEIKCGRANLICPEGSSVPVVVPAGYFSNEDTREDIRWYKTQCPPGYYCPGDGRRYMCPNGTYADVPGSTTEKCQGLCDYGYYCGQGSSSPRQYECGSPTVYCVRGSSAPTVISPGFYGIFTGVAAGTRALYNPQNTTFSAEIPCDPGYYCTGGLKYPCPPGYFGWRYGMSEPICGGQCARGYYCPSYLKPVDNPQAPASTIWPGQPHTSAAELKCGNAALYCPRGSFFPLLVGGGNFTVGGNLDNSTRYEQRVCPPGSFCVNGIMLQCPKGRYGDKPGLFDPSCTAPCPAGYYCPEGTAEPILCPPNTYSSGSGSVCSECPGTRGSDDPAPCTNSRSCCFR